jgi:hypothetical protein
MGTDRRTSQAPPKDSTTTHTGFNACKIGLQQAENLQNLRPPPDVPSKGLTCYTDVGEQWSRRLIPKPKPAKRATYRQETRMHADDGLPSPHHAPKVSPARFDPSYSLDNGHQGSSNFVQSPQGQGARPHTRFQRACKIRPSKPKLLQNLRPPLLDVYLGLTCYTDVEEQWSRRLIQNSNRVRPTSKTHARR